VVLLPDDVNCGVLQTERVGPSKALALKLYRARKTQVAERRFFPATDVLFEEIVDDAIAIARARFESKHPGREAKKGNYGIVRDWFPGREADTITPSEIEAKLADHTQVPATFNRFRVAISHAYKLAIENGKLAKNPGLLVKMRRENNEIVRYLNQFSEKGKESEETRLRKAIRELHPAKEPEIDLAIHTGLRWAEQYYLAWSNVDLVRNVIKIVRPKGGKDQHVPINAEARKALARLRTMAPKSDLVCPANDYDQHRNWWLDVLATAGIDDFRWHDLRHTFASRLVMNGVDIFTVCRLLRHKSVQTTMRYAHLGDKHLASAVARLVGGVSASDTLSDTTTQASTGQQEYLQ